MPEERSDTWLKAALHKVLPAARKKGPGLKKLFRQHSECTKSKRISERALMASQSMTGLR
jgi:hypothetical protein